MFKETHTHNVLAPLRLFCLVSEARSRSGESHVALSQQVLEELESSLVLEGVAFLVVLAHFLG